MALLPSGYSGTQAVALVRAKTNYAQQPVDATIYTFLQVALEQVQNELKVLRKYSSTAVIGGQATFIAPTDMQDFLAFTYSTDLPTNPGVIEYTMVEVGPEQFVDATWNAPTIGGGPVVLYRRLTDANNQLTIQLYPIAPGGTGYINCYYYARPQLWDPANPATVPDTDSVYQYNAIILACALCAESKENTRKATYFNGQYSQWLESARNQVGKRQRQSRSQVRDVLSAPSVIPSWMAGGTI